MKIVFLSSLLLFSLFLTNITCYAAFPICDEAGVTVNNMLVNSPGIYTSRKQAGEKIDGEKASKSHLGVLSLMFCGLAILAMLAGIGLGGGAVAFVLFGAFSITAIVLGAFGLEEKNSGFAIAGMILGILEAFVFGLLILFATASYK